MQNVSRSVGIIGNDSLTDLNGLARLSGLTNLTIRGNSQLENLQGLDALTYVPGTLKIMSNEALIDLQGLESLESIGGELDVSYNTHLETLEAFKTSPR